MDLAQLAAPEIRFDRLVPRALVDRGDTTTVLITDWHTSGNRLTAGAVWSRLGGYYTLLDHGTHDPLLVLETFRQAALLIAHVVDDVPLATMQIMRSVEFTTTRPALAVTADPTEVTAVLTTERQGGDRQSILQTGISLELYRGDDLIARGHGQAIVPPGDRYLRVRGRDPQEVVLSRAGMGPGVEPEQAGRLLERDVVISPGTGTGHYHLRVDPEHPNFFDNPTDHAPGMLLTEAMRQAVVVASGDPHYTPLALSVQFFRFVELDAPAHVSVRLGPDGFRTEVRQFDRLAARASWPPAGDAA
ncbi:ScbA/BarX family gamma-butyrolactone biosynthesis protein [Micromonospora sp. NPDC092111]|uniref:ScbA/BarX family gamma-butyrolactone biosynthesis protein n=1 Tax=Micromonospora sp. NPDC092111 TaxID=3364289 RepID=UPI0038234127